MTLPHFLTWDLSLHRKQPFWENIICIQAPGQEGFIECTWLFVVLSRTWKKVSEILKILCRSQENLKNKEIPDFFIHTDIWGTAINFLRLKYL